MCAAYIGFADRAGETAPSGTERPAAACVPERAAATRMSILESLRPPPGLRVLVTAGAGGIGAAIARAFHEAGSRVHVCDLDRCALDRMTAETPGITGSMADASVAADVDLVFDDLQVTLGGLDVLVGNAGIAGPTGPIEAIDGAGWERTIAVNLHSQYYFARRAVPLLKQSTAGPCLITLGSGAGRLGCAFRTPYASSKWAIVGLVKSLALELGPHDIRVNAILPGAVDGDGVRGVIAFRAAAAGVSLDDRRQQVVDKTSRRRMVTADDVAAMALFLCSPAARDLSGQAISVDGDLDYF
jgi:NAD(P)-dependent dehydrogenase (short-subunit alcohol dehydrogenase family)